MHSANANLDVRSSLIHGTGVFAKKAFRKGEVVVPWENSKPLTEAQFAALPAEERRFTDKVDGQMYAIGKPERFVNHSCDPNTIPGRLCDIAGRDISAGEEITADYGGFFILAGSFECRCGLPNCRGTIVGRTS